MLYPGEVSRAGSQFLVHFCWAFTCQGLIFFSWLFEVPKICQTNKKSTGKTTKIGRRIYDATRPKRVGGSKTKDSLMQFSGYVRMNGALKGTSNFCTGCHGCLFLCILNPRTFCILQKLFTVKSSVILIKLENM